MPLSRDRRHGKPDRQRSYSRIIFFLHWLETDGKFNRNGDLSDFPYSASLKILLKVQNFCNCYMLGIGRILKKLLLTGMLFK